MMKKILHSAAALLLTCGLAFAAFSVSFDGKIIPNGATPVLSACGTGVLATGSSDVAGDFTTTGATGCTLTFGVAYATAPSCAVIENSANLATRTTTVTTTAIVVAAGTSGSKYSYVCMAKAGG
jgi:hypothetical protein